MRALIQRVSEARVDIAGETVGQIGAGVMILICAMQGDTPEMADKLAAKISKMRIFPDAEGKMNLSLMDTHKAALVVSQFTLSADTRRGNRPGFSTAAAPADGDALYQHFSQALRDLGVQVENGRFGADMQVHLCNDGPVTIWVDTEA
ncbi:D-aminoacyl-tRNA deacylase [Donghicola tyrosinivorans]|uniref:D-aminoacyl-tRNA deacylase n=1 Tax=Donghicola tyrosinivorans TaxID=1652492 RepID=A0A2T0X4M0_9RHOB|nr:D-aminoacyl-tRNA deacylase [Donghicola tyrosinivorans]PRY93888.1 D-tyrosyl-tRNA(Tyr) deacylase [Donghicola tyrosinivorans]